MRNLIALAMGAGCAMSLAISFAAEMPYPQRPVRVVVPFGPGGSPDVLARALGAQLEAQLGKTFIIDNRAGANGIIGAEIVARAAPDGYTVMHTPRMREILDASGFVAVANTPDEFRAFVRAEIKRYEQIVRDANVKVE